MPSTDPAAPLATWQPPRAPGRMVLEGRFCRLEPLTEAHAPALHAANTDPARWAWLPYGPFESLAAYTAWISEQSRHPDPLFFTVITPAGPLGIMSLMRIAPAAGSIELGHIHLSPALSGTPAATEAMTTLIGWAFEAGYRRFEWKCDAANRPSRRAAERLGLSYEGIFRQAGVVKGRNRDTAWFAAIDTEWPALSAAYAAWLSPDNFDSEGRQRTRLSTLTRPILVASDPIAEDDP